MEAGTGFFHPWRAIQLVAECLVLIRFDERFALPVGEVFSYFATPADWVRLYGFAGQARDLGSGWFSIGLKRFPFPLVARVTELEQDRKVHWTFRGFWRGEGEVRFSPSPDGVLLEGYERISVRWLFVLSPIVEKLFLEKQFRAIWQLGWRRLHKREPAATP
jgi:hypothetical protein